MPVRAYSEFTTSLDNLLLEAAETPWSSELRKRIAHALDGQAAAELRRSVSLEALRADGIFFTSSDLARRAVQNLLPTFRPDSVILDPACGAGNLLIACAAGLPAAQEHKETLRLWGSCLAGRELHPEFVETARRRLLLSSLALHAEGSASYPVDVDGAFPGLRSHCGLTDHQIIGAATHIVMNPPFGMIPAPANCSWGTGKVNMAALFLEAVLLAARPGARIAAILPEVLRSGSRYRKWRDLVSARARFERIEILGRFDRWTDVDVFLLELEVPGPRENSGWPSWRETERPLGGCIGDHFESCIGPVVDYRDPHRGPLHPFIHSRDLPPWKTVREIPRRRRFEGRVLAPPFVAIRRTSRPGDRHRAIGTLIAGPKPIAVENHLIVLRPKDGTVRSCRELLGVLKDERTTHWLDERIRCRHLTVTALDGLPWWHSAP
jgi:hypothetical protein